MTTTRQPVVFLPHGGGPWPFVDMDFGDAEGAQSLRAYLESLGTLLAEKPKALLVVSAHWEMPVATVMTSSTPGMLYDYGGFPPKAYTLQWPAPGAPHVAERVATCLRNSGFDVGADAQRGFDHGVFIPLMLAFPKADIPTLQLSLKQGLRPEEHLRIGQALAPLRDEGILILGSGMSYHNMRGFFDARARPHAESFDAWLRDTMACAVDERNERLIRWESAPSARQVHPREEHLLPLHVMVGAAGADVAQLAWNGTFAHMRLSAWHFGMSSGVR